MTVQQLQERLKTFPPDMELMILDAFNGQGNPRTLNFGPVERTITEENEQEAGDCEGRVGEKMVVIGFGCY